MTQPFTASEVRGQASTFGRGRVNDMLRAYADRLEADEKAVPVVDDSTIGFCGGRRVSLASMGRDPEVRKKLMDLLDFMNKMESVRNQPTEDTSPPKYDPLHTAAADAERLAEALRGILEIGKRNMENQKYDGFFNAAREALAAHSAQAQPPSQSKYAPPYPDQAQDPFWKVPGMVDTRPKAQPPAVNVRDGYVKCERCETRMTGYGYGEFPKLCPACQDAAQENPNG